MRAFLALSLLVPSSCLLVDATVSLSPAPTVAAISREHGNVVLEPVVDRTHTRGRVGVKKNGMGTESADIRSELPVATWFGQRLHNELAAAGLTVLETDPTAPQIEVSVLDFFAEPAVDTAFELHALIHAEVIVQLPDGRRFARRFAQHRQSTELTLTGGMYEELLDEAIRAWMAEVIPAIVSLLEEGQTARTRPEAWQWLG